MSGYRWWTCKRWDDNYSRGWKLGPIAFQRYDDDWDLCLFNRWTYSTYLRRVARGETD